VKARTAKVERLAEYLFDGVEQLPGEELDADLGNWLSESSRFLVFADANKDKIRKKLRSATDPGARGDVRAELETAYLLLADRRIELAFEAYGSGQRGPDFTVTFRASHRFNLEVTRPRGNHGDSTASAAGALLAKLRQLPVDAPNVLLLASGLADSDAAVESMIRSLKVRADRGEEEVFAARGLSTKEFQVLHRRLALVMVGSRGRSGIHAWVNPEARRKLPDGAANACLVALGPASWAG
jgi:hypothetical protein